MATTGNRQFKKDPRIITSLLVIIIRTDGRKKIFDWFFIWLMACGLGHSVPAIKKAVLSKLKRSTTLMPFNMAMRVRFYCPSKSLNSMPSRSNRFSFTGSGSESVDTAKVGRAYWRKKGMGNQTNLLASKGYHGAQWFFCFQCPAYFQRTATLYGKVRVLSFTAHSSTW